MAGVNCRPKYSDTPEVITTFGDSDGENKDVVEGVNCPTKKQ